MNQSCFVFGGKINCVENFSSDENNVIGRMEGDIEGSSPIESIGNYIDRMNSATSTERKSLSSNHNVRSRSQTTVKTTSKPRRINNMSRQRRGNPNKLETNYINKMKKANSGRGRSLSASTNVRSRNSRSSFDQTTSKPNGQNIIQKLILQQRKGSKENLKLGRLKPRKLKPRKLKTRKQSKPKRRRGKKGKKGNSLSASSGVRQRKPSESNVEFFSDSGKCDLVSEVCNEYCSENDVNCELHCEEVVHYCKSPLLNSLYHDYDMNFSDDGFYEDNRS